MSLDETKSDFGQQIATRFHEGMMRVQQGFFQSLQIVVSGIGAYAFAHSVLGHHEPIFAATAAIVSLGYVRGATHSRRMLEVTIGVTLGIFIGDLLMLLLGRGVWQAAVVLFLSIQIARFLDNGIIFTIQMGLQSCLVVLMVPTSDGVFARSVDAIVGGLFAFLLMFFFPKDPRAEPRTNLQKLSESFADVLRNSAESIDRYDWDKAQSALEQARSLEPLYEAAKGDVSTAKGMAKLSMLGRRYREELDEYSNILTGLDLAIRNTRVLNRRMASTINHVRISQDAIESISDVLRQISVAVADLGEVFYLSDQKDRAALRLRVRRTLSGVSSTLEPSLMGVKTLEAESLVLMLRPLVTDLLEATGLNHKDASKLLIPLGESMTEHAPRTNKIKRVEQTSRVVNTFNEEDNTENLKPDDTRALNIVLRKQQEKPLDDE